VDPDPNGPEPDLPGLAQVRAAVRSDRPPAALAGFLTTPQPDLEAPVREGRGDGAADRAASL